MGTGARFLSICQDTWKHMTLARRADGADRHRVMRDWAERILAHLGVRVEIVGKPAAEPALYLGNHVSYVDIPLLMAQVPVVFVAKKELARWPLFGSAMKSVGTVFVDRSSRESRKAVAHQLATVLKSRRQPVAVFPSGTTTVDESKPWRFGIFQIAREGGIPVQPFRLTYEPLRTAAFILDDAFVPHLWRLLKQPVRARLEFGEVMEVKEPERDGERLRTWTQQGIVL